jgi:hypothetical protein
MSDRWRRRPAVESLEGRMLLTGSDLPINPVPIRPDAIETPTPRQLGAAYHQVEAIQAETLQAISAAHRRLYAAFDQLAARANPAVGRDRRILQQAADITARAEQGLVVARGVENQSANTDKIYIPNGLIPSGLGTFVKQAQTTGSNLARSARRGTDAAIRELDILGAHLAEPAGPRR